MDELSFIGSGLLYIAITIVVSIVIILICREIVAWYTKRNKQLEKAETQITNQKKIIELLEEQNKLLKEVNENKSVKKKEKKDEEDSQIK